MTGKIVLQAYIFLLLILALSTCGAPAGGPQAWLDWPLDNTTVPLAPLTIQAHASDEDGVAHFELFANNTPLFTVNSDGKRLGEAVVEWTPPGPGIYTIRVHAVDSGGNVGSDATAIVTVSGELLATQPPPLLLAETATTYAQPIDNIVTDAPDQGNNSGAPTVKATLDCELSQRTWNSLCCDRLPVQQAGGKHLRTQCR